MLQLFKPKDCLILIVDDFPANIRLLTAILEKAGYNTTFAKSGEQALERVESAKIDLILLDFMMPGMNGIEVCQKLKSTPKNQEIPIIFITANQDINILLKAFTEGAIDYLVKPFNSDELLLRVKNHLMLSKAYLGLRKANDQLIEAYALMEQLIVLDPLTGTKNRRALIEFGEIQFTLTKRYGHAFSIMFIDLDYFKKINDQFGHLAGDEILINIAKIFKNNLREVDQFGRFGGEEFIAILPNTNLSNAMVLAERIREIIADFTHEFENQNIQVTVSIGIASSQALDDNFNQMIKRADQALYCAKNSGRNCTRTE